MSFIKASISAVFILLLSACMGGIGANKLEANTLSGKYDLQPNPTPDSFTICYTGGCQKKAPIHISKKDWQNLTSAFKKNKTAAAERKTIADTIGKLEVIAGKQSWTNRDKGGNADGFGSPGQMDCMDESINTSQYLLMLEQSGALKFHDVMFPTMRSKILFGLHRTAQIKDKKTGAFYAVDSWYEDNGVKPYIVPMDEWLAGWHPTRILGNEVP